jgi:pyruvate formate lyase activating enzyme
MTPEQVAESAKRAGCRSIAYTYTEPVIFYEYMYDCAAAGRKQGVKSVMISNGYIQEKPLRELIPVLDAVKIDLKAFTDSFYQELCSGELEPVLNTLKILEEEKIWFEIVMLIIPTKNDSMDEIRELCTWVKDRLSDSVPIHFTRFHPIYKVKDIPPTPHSTLKTAYETAKKTGIRFPYVGNVAGDERESTYCPNCGKRVVERVGFYSPKVDLVRGNCSSCGTPISGIWF